MCFVPLPHSHSETLKDPELLAKMSDMTRIRQLVNLRLCSTIQRTFIQHLSIHTHSHSHTHTHTHTLTHTLTHSHIHTHTHTLTHTHSHTHTLTLSHTHTLSHSHTHTHTHTHTLSHAHSHSHIHSHIHKNSTLFPVMQALLKLHRLRYQVRDSPPSMEPLSVQVGQIFQLVNGGGAGLGGVGGASEVEGQPDSAPSRLASAQEQVTVH